jgi:tRNA threonylcarbamoyladenosine biosynthesis protein TsaB
MRLLALDTATEACSAAILVEGRTLARFELAGRSHTQQMLPMVHGLMAEAGLSFAQIDGFVCGIGPGSFAGVRIGVGFVKGLALSLDRPVVGISSLTMLAQAALDGGAQRVIASIDARMNEIYVGLFEADVDGLSRPMGLLRVMPPEQFRENATGPWHAVGTGWGTYEATMRPGVAGDVVHVDGAALPRAQTALKLALSEFAGGKALAADDLAPLYLRDKVALTLEEQVQLRASRN